MSKRKGFINRMLDIVERSGNKLPDPTTLFVLMILFVIFGSVVASMIGVSATHPADGRIIAAESLLSSSNIRRMLTDMVKNFAGFPPLGLVLVTVIGIGVAERAGLINSALKGLVTSVPKSLLSATLVFAGIMSSLAADAGYVVLTPLGAVLFAAFGRHPLAGMAAAFAGVSGGFSANLFITSLDPLLSGLSTTSAVIIDPNYVVQPSANYWFMLASTGFLTVIGAFVTDKIVEPRLGKWTPPEGFIVDTKFGEISRNEKKGLWAAGLAFFISIFIILALVVPSNGVLRHPETAALQPFYESLVALIMLLFLALGIVYGIVAKTIRSDKDVVRMANEQMATMGAYIVLAFVASQFVAYFQWSNMGLIFAISGADFLKAIGFQGIPLIISFLIVTSFINIFIGSASAKWAIMGPVFVPMFMLMGYSPELIQNTYRIGDSVTNIISPLLPYFPIIIAFAKKYDPKIGIGTIISTMIPFSIAYFIFWTILLSIWMIAGWPLGPDAPMYYSP